MTNVTSLKMDFNASFDQVFELSAIMSPSFSTRTSHWSETAEISNYITPCVTVNVPHLDTPQKGFHMVRFLNKNSVPMNEHVATKQKRIWRNY